MTSQKQLEMDTGPAAGTEPWEVVCDNWLIGLKGGSVVTLRDAFKAGWDACAAFYDGKNGERSWARSLALDSFYAHIDAITAEDIYDAFPRKVGKQAAIKAIEKALKLLKPKWLLERTKAYAAAVAKWPAGDRQYVPHCSTWMNRGSYDDDPKEWQRGASQGVQIRAAN
jgi:hypothetical protein